jgi:hypothetical protein
MASCSASAASSGSPSVLIATAQSRSRCRPKSRPKASASPPICQDSRSASAAPAAVSPGPALRESGRDDPPERWPCDPVVMPPPARAPLYPDCDRATPRARPVQPTAIPSVPG